MQNVRSVQTIVKYLTYSVMRHEQVMGRKEEVAARLRQAREAKEYSTAKEAARAFGFNGNTYSSHENGNRGLSPDAAVRYGKAFGVSGAWLLTGEGRGPRGTRDNRKRRTQDVEIVGHVQAGTWREAMEWPEEERYAEPVHESRRYPGVPRFGLEVRGDSMDRRVEDGAIVYCIRFSDLGRGPKHGDYVVCQRFNDSGAVEATLKRLEVRDDGIAWLLPESNNPEHQQPIRLGELHKKSGEEIQLAAHVSAGPLDGTEDIQIVALVDQYLGEM